MKENKTQRSVGLTWSMIEAIGVMAKKQGRTWSEMARILIEAGMRAARKV